MKRGFTIIELIVTCAIIFVIFACFIAGCGDTVNKHVVGNKQYFDFKQTFNYAYVQDGTNTVKYHIKAWKDWQNSDAIQFITVDGQTFYTHLNRVMLSDK